MKLLAGLLLDPGPRFSTYLLRLFVVLELGHYVVSIANRAVPDSIDAYSELVRDTPWSQLLLWDTLATALLWTALTWAAVSAAGTVARRPLTKGIVCAPAAGLAAVYFWGALAAAWSIFVVVVAFEVGRRSSLRHALAAVGILLLAHNALAIVMWKTLP
jgi:hypothetical protein